MTFISHEQLKQRAKERPEGYVEDVLSRATLVTGGILLDDKAMSELLAKYHPRLGDIVARLAKPVARGIDSILGTDLEHCRGCEKRREWLNSLTK